MKKEYIAPVAKTIYLVERESMLLEGSQGQVHPGETEEQWSNRREGDASGSLWDDREW